MKKLISLGLALLLCLGVSAQVAQTGGGKAIVAAGGGGSLLFDTAVDAAIDDPVGGALTSAAMTIATTANRWAIGSIITRDSVSPPPGAHTEMRLGGSAGTLISPQLGTTTTFAANSKVSRWNLAWNSGTTGSQTCYGLADAVEPEMLIACAVYNGVNQTTPVVSTPTATSGQITDTQTSTTASITCATVSGNVCVVVLSIVSTDSGLVTITCAGENIRTNEHYLLNSLAIVDRTATGASTTVDCTLSIGAAGPTVDWRMDGYVIQVP